MPRNTCDVDRLNMFGKLCCTHNMHFLNGCMFDDAEGHFTCIANGGHSLVDYHIASSELFPFVSFFKVKDNDDSDHFPVSAILTFKHRKRFNT